VSVYVCVSVCKRGGYILFYFIFFLRGGYILNIMVKEVPTMWGEPSQINPTFCLINQGQRDTRKVNQGQSVYFSLIDIVLNYTIVKHKMLIYLS